MENKMRTIHIGMDYFTSLLDRVIRDKVEEMLIRHIYDRFADIEDGIEAVSNGTTDAMIGMFGSIYLQVMNPAIMFGSKKYIKQEGYVLEL